MRTLLAQNYPLFEVVVLDDQSEDDTYEIVHHIRDRDGRLRVLVGADLPTGWCGKPHACWQLARAARGTYVLFTDADCRLAPDALLMAVGAAGEHSADLVSLMPEYVVGTFWERLIIPLLVLIPICFLPIGLVRKSRYPLFAGANGSFLFMRRETYLSIDGHRAVRNQLAEDVKFAQHVKRSGYTEWYGDGTGLYSVRMYETGSEIRQGFSRNLFPAFSRNTALLGAVIVSIAILLVLPLFFATVGLLIGADWVVYPALSYGLMAGVGLVCWSLYGQGNAGFAFLYPFAWMAAILIALESIARAKMGTIEWKGRTYSASESTVESESNPEV